MSVASFERELVWALRAICQNAKIRVKDVQEWNTSEAAVRGNLRADETAVYVPTCGVWVAIPSALVKAPLAPCNQEKKK